MNDNEKIIHLFVTSQCNHDCPLCCNKQYDIDKIPVVTVDELKNAHTVLITGGEPLIFNIPPFIGMLRQQYPNITALYVYTSGSPNIDRILCKVVDGINFSPKDVFDVMDLMDIFIKRKNELRLLSSNRLYLFPEIPEPYAEQLTRLANSIGNFLIVHREWQEEFKPASGIFRRLPVLFSLPQILL